jgi:ABC-type lipoprotein release transport system permease subunit
LLRTLIHYWRINLAVLLGAAVATTVLTGALLVGDSVRGSLRDLVLERLGDIDAALVTDRFFREELAEQLAGRPGARAVAPAILLRGAAVYPDAGTRAAQVTIQGVDSRFSALFGEQAGIDLERGEGQIFPSVVINETLRRELQAEVGESLLLSFGRSSHVPRDTLMGEKDPEDVLSSLRLTVTDVLPDRGVGRFGLSPNQHRPLNAFVALEQLQRVLEQPGQVNALLIRRATAEADLDAELSEVLTLEDLGLRVHEADDHFRVESREFVLRPTVEQAVDAVVDRLGAPVQRVQSYLINDARAGDRRLPYSLVAAVDRVSGPPWASLSLIDGGSPDLPAEGGMLLNSWAAEDLSVGPGDTIEASYFVVGPREELTVEQSRFTIEGIVAIEGLAADRTLTPDYPGIQQTEDIVAWDPPFPVELDRIRTKDEDYWDRYGATPKAFVSAEAGRALWSTRYGTTTSVRIGVGEAGSVSDAAQRFRRELETELSPEAFGFRFREVKQQGLAASAGATDFAMLFIGFSLFLIVSSALLVGLLFSLGVEQRAGEIGLLLAVGHRLRAVRLRLLAEGGLLAALGALVGLLGGVGYAWLLMAALRTIWLAAVGSSQLFLHVEPLSLLIGWFVAVAVVLLSVARTTRRLKRVPPPSLLAGSLQTPARVKRARLAPWLAGVCLAVALSLIVYAALSGSLSAIVLAFGAGSLLLVAGLAFFSLWCHGTRRRARSSPVLRAVVGMAARNSAWSPGRSILSVALVASACFVIVALAANREELGEGFEARESGSGGFSLIAEADVPLHQDLNRAESRFELGFSDEDSRLLESVEFFPLRLLPGDDASCLNLYLPERPRVLGAPAELVERGGFVFQQHTELPDGVANPWKLLEVPLEPGVVPAIADYNSAMWILHLGLGGELEMENELGEPIRLRLVGLLKTSILQSELVVSERSLLESFPGRTGFAYFLVDAPAERVEEVARVLESNLGSYGFDTTSARERLAAYKEVEHTYISTFQLLGGLGLLLGTLGLAIILVRNVIERRGELATLRAFGFRRSSLAWMVLAENAFLLLVGMLIGTLSALLAVAPRLATIHAPWGTLAATLAAVLFVGMLSSVAAVSGALRTPLLPALKEEH